MQKPSIYELINMVEQVNNASIIKFTEGLSQPIGISGVIVLSEIKKCGKCKPIDLAKQLGYSKSSITAISTKLMDAGYIVRSEDQHDRRTVYFSITEKGTATLKEVEMLGQDYYATIYSVLSEEELHQYIRIQRKLLFHIKNK